MFSDREQVWWIVPAGKRVRHAIADRPGAKPAGASVQALCSASVKIPYETWPAEREPATRGITERCLDCQAQVSRQQERTRDLVVSTWDN